MCRAGTETQHGEWSCGHTVGGEGGTKGEIRAEIYPPPGVKEAAGGKLL